MKNYNRHAALAYAKRWAFARNPKYADFSLMGGDCTNFISQCLVAGEMPMNYTRTFGWYYISLNNRAPAFTSAEFLYNFLTRKNSSVGPVAIQTTQEDLEIGDIVQISFGENFTHSLLVTSKQGNEIFVAAHSFDAYNRNIQSYAYTKIRYLHILGAN